MTQQYCHNWHYQSSCLADWSLIISTCSNLLILLVFGLLCLLLLVFLLFLLGQRVVCCGSLGVWLRLADPKTSSPQAWVSPGLELVFFPLEGALVHVTEERNPVLVVVCSLVLT